jgi:succinyl-CoA synthetase alpha subunit
MAILIDEKKRVLVQGITGREGRARTRLVREYQNEWSDQAYRFLISS